MSDQNKAPEDDPVLEIAGTFYNQKQAATMAFNTYHMSDEVLDAGLLTWHALTGDRSFSLKDYAFLVLYFLDKLATDEIREIYRDHIPRIKEALL